MSSRKRPATIDELVLPRATIQKPEVNAVSAEAEPFDSIGDVIDEVRALDVFLAPLGNSAHQKILARLASSTVLAHSKPVYKQSMEVDGGGSSSGTTMDPNLQPMALDVPQLANAILDSDDVSSTIPQPKARKLQMLEARAFSGDVPSSSVDSSVEPNQLPSNSDSIVDQHVDVLMETKPSCEESDNSPGFLHSGVSEDRLSSDDSQRASAEPAELDDHSNCYEDPITDTEWDSQEFARLVPSMTPEEILRRFKRFSHGELIGMMVSKDPHLKRHAHDALMAKKKRELLVIEISATHLPMKFLLDNNPGRSWLDFEEIDLDEGDDYPRQLIKALHILLTVFDAERCEIVVWHYFNFFACYRRAALPFDSYFEPNSDKIPVHYVYIHNWVLAKLLRFVSPNRVQMTVPSKHLFDKNGELMIGGQDSLELDSKLVDKVDKLMDQITIRRIKLAKNSAWSDESVKKTLTAHAETDGESPRFITCYYFEEDRVKPHQRTLQQWKKLFADWRVSYKSLNPDYPVGRIRMSSCFNSEVTFELDSYNRATAEFRDYW